MAEEQFDQDWEDMSSGSDGGDGDMFEAQHDSSEDDDGDDVGNADPMNIIARLLGVIGGRCVDKALTTFNSQQAPFHLLLWLAGALLVHESWASYEEVTMMMTTMKLRTKMLKKSWKTWVQMKLHERA